MAKFRKRPMVVDAIRYEGIVSETILTLEGAMTVNPGDWIITGIQGERYPCKDAIFRLTYEECNQAESRAFLMASNV